MKGRQKDTRDAKTGRGWGHHTGKLGIAESWGDEWG